MAKKNTNSNVDTTMETLAKSESFIVKHKIKLIVAASLAAGLVIGYLIYEGIQDKKDQEGREALITIEQKGMDAPKSIEANLELSLEDVYSSILADYESYLKEHEGHIVGIAPFQAGVAAFHTGDYNKAIGFFSQYDGSDNIYNARAKACIGDCYVALEDYENALANYESAIEINDFVWTPEYLFKAAIVAEKLGNNEKALAMYKRIKNEFPHSMLVQQGQIDKYIGRVEAK